LSLKQVSIIIDELYRENKMTQRFSSAEFSKIARLMQTHHSLFYEMWNIGKPVFDESIPTACIQFNKEGEQIQFRINPTFWESQTDVQKCFVIGHESLHGVCNHGIRANVKIDANANRAMDLVVNHLLVNGFGFVREECDPENKYCWIDTVLKDCPVPVRENESFEYYLRLVNKYANNCTQELVDFHELMGDASEVLKHLGEALSEETKEQLKEMIKKHMPKNIDDPQKGDGAGGMEYLVPSKKPKRKKKWETVIKKWMKKVLSIRDKDIYQWARINRRFSILDGEMKIPSEMEMEDHFQDDRRILVWFFQDTSGSCSGFMDRFFAAAESLPPDRFEVKMHCFDTAVYETDLKSRKLYGFGGTTFTCIEAHIQSYCAQHHCPYPTAVFVVTDGAGNVVHPEKPKNWYWFLSSANYSCIPAASSKFLLENYE
jgi:predicted metal-dependent peptidase